MLEGAALPLLTTLSSVPTPTLAIAALALTFVGIIVVYMLSRIVNSPPLEAFMREEFAHFILTVAIFALWLVFYSIFLGIASATVCGGASCDIMAVALYSLSIIKAKLFGIYINILGYEAIIGFLSTVGVSLPIPMANMIASNTWIGFSPLGGLGILSNVLITLVESVGFLIGLVIGRIFLLNFFSAIVPYVMLPMGLAMRALPFTRRTGSSLIALSFAAYFIFPLSVILSHGLIFGSAYTPDLDTSTYISDVPTFAKICDDPNGDYATSTSIEAGEKLAGESQVSYESWWWQSKAFVGESADFAGEQLWEEGGFIDYFKTHYNTGGAWLAMAGKYATMGPSAAINPVTFAHAAYYFSMAQIPNIMRFAVFVMTTFVLEIIITVTGYRAIAHAIGGELEILGLTKVV